MIRTQFLHSYDNEYNRFKREGFMMWNTLRILETNSLFIITILLSQSLFSTVNGVYDLFLPLPRFLLYFSLFLTPTTCLHKYQILSIDTSSFLFHLPFLSHIFGICSHLQPEWPFFCLNRRSPKLSRDLNLRFSVCRSMNDRIVVHIFVRVNRVVFRFQI